MQVRFTREEFHITFDADLGNGMVLLGCLYNHKTPELWGLKIEGVEFRFYQNMPALPDGDFKAELLYRFDTWEMYEERRERISKARLEGKGPTSEGPCSNMHEPIGDNYTEWE